MARKDTDGQSFPEKRTLISKAFEGDQAPAQLSVAIVSLVELCNLAMPDPVKLRERLKEAGFELGKQEKADEAGQALALDIRMMSTPVQKLQHEIYGKQRHDEPVIILLSEGESEGAKVVFCSALFKGAIEADAIKAAAHVMKKPPFTGARLSNDDLHWVRRVFWDAEGAAGARGFVVSGPADVESTDLPRAFTAFNKVATKR